MRAWGDGLCPSDLLLLGHRRAILSFNRAASWPIEFYHRLYERLM
jgi:hypothetical protein